MAGSLYPVACPFEDCLYHIRMPIQGDPVFCSHPDKKRFGGSQACPLYQYNWAKKLEAFRK